MARLSPVVNYPDRRLLLPNITKGDYYVMKSSLTGDTKYVYPRMMQSSYFPVVTKSQLLRQGLGDDGPTDLWSLLASAPGTAVQRVQQTSEDVAAVRRAANITMLTGLASVAMLGILLWRTR
jgi:hypothetical protein